MRVTDKKQMQEFFNTFKILGNELSEDRLIIQNRIPFGSGVQNWSSTIAYKDLSGNMKLIRHRGNINLELDENIKFIALNIKDREFLLKKQKDMTAMEFDNYKKDEFYNAYIIIEDGFLNKI